jgi:transcriptional regulator with GAF, ATPase, and Fis domain
MGIVGGRFADMSRCKLTILEGGRSRVVLLNEWSVRVGREAPCDLILHSSAVADAHCHLLRTHEGYVLEDLGSATGTFVNDARVKHQLLHSGDEIRIGDVTIRYDWTPDDPHVVSVIGDQDPTMMFRLDFVGQESAATRLFSGSAASRISHLYGFIRRCAELGSELSPEEQFLERSMRGLCELPGVQRAQVMYRQGSTESLECVATGVSGGHDAPATNELHQLLVRRALQEGEAVLCDESAGAGAERTRTGDLAESGNLIAVPLRREDAIFGLLVLTASAAGPGFVREDLEFAVAFARLLEIEIERRRFQLRVIAENERLREKLGEGRELVGHSPQIRKLLDDVDRAAKSDATVLIIGESGTGKELVARLLQHKSRRRDEAFVSVNCAVLHGDLLASDLFGHLKGSFTGAVADRAGKFELADRGTLFFDEIAELPFPLQAKLLRALQEGEIERVGGGVPRAVNVRVIAATNRDLEKEVQMGAFRQDLYFRLNVIVLRVPPLRERPGDAQRLLTHFADYFARKMGTPRLRIPSEILAALERYSWPGNVRELRNLVERCVVMSHSGSMTLEDLPMAIVSGLTVEEDPHAGTRTLDSQERDHISRVLEECGRNKSRAARTLGIDRSTLYDKMRRLGIPDTGRQSHASEHVESSGRPRSTREPDRETP